MIVRCWKGVVRQDCAERYVAHLESEVFPILQQLQGHCGTQVLRRQVPRGEEFVVLSRWRSIKAVQSFAGPEIEVSVVPPKAQQLMVEFDDRVTHYQVASEYLI